MKTTSYEIRDIVQSAAYAEIICSTAYTTRRYLTEHVIPASYEIPWTILADIKLKELVK